MPKPFYPLDSYSVSLRYWRHCWVLRQGTATILATYKYENYLVAKAWGRWLARINNVPFREFIPFHVDLPGEGDVVTPLTGNKPKEILK